MNKKYGYTVTEAVKELACEPDEEEKQRLLDYYPSYESKKHRKGFLKDVFEYKAHNEIAQNKIKNTQSSSQISKQQVGAMQSGQLLN